MRIWHAAPSASVLSIEIAWDVVLTKNAEVGKSGAQGVRKAKIQGCIFLSAVLRR